MYPDINNGFLVHLLQLAANRKKGQIVSAAICHLCRNNDALTSLLVQCIRRGLEWFDFDSIRSYFRVLTALVLLKDDLQAVRVAAIMGMLLEVIRAQLRYWKTTDTCCDHLIRLAKLSPLALQYIHSHTSDLEPLLNFFSSHPDPPTPHRYQLQSSAAGVQLFKPREHYNVSRPQSAFEAYGMPTRTKLAVLENLMRGGEVDDAAGTGSDSDQDFSERVLEEGQWVDALDTASKWLCAQVVSVAGSKVLLRYSGWCFAPETKLLLADGGEIAAGDVVPQQVLPGGTVLPGTVLLDELGQPTPVTAVDRGYAEIQSENGGRVQRVPRADHPTKDMYSFQIVGHIAPSETAATLPPLVVSADHLVELVNLTRPTVSTCSAGVSYSVEHWELDGNTHFMARSCYGGFCTEEQANEFATDLPFPVRWSPRASLFYAYLQSDTCDNHKRSWSMYQPSALSIASKLKTVTPLAFTGVGRFREAVQGALHPATLSEQQLTPDLLHRLAWLIGFWLADNSVDQLAVTPRHSGKPDGSGADQLAFDEVASITHAVHELCRGSPLESGLQSCLGQLVMGLGVLGNRHVPKAILADSVDVRRHCLAGIVDGNGRLEQETRGYAVTCMQAADDLTSGLVHLARGLGYAVGGRRQTTTPGELGSVCHWSIAGVPDFTDPLGLPVVLLHKRIKLPQPIEPHTYSYPRMLAAVAAIDSHEYVGITVPHGLMLIAEALVVHNSDKWLAQHPHTNSTQRHNTNTSSSSTIADRVSLSCMFV